MRKLPPGASGEGGLWVGQPSAGVDPARGGLAANASGGIIWATGITYLIWFLGMAAEKWLSRLS